MTEIQRSHVGREIREACTQLRDALDRLYEAQEELFAKEDHLNDPRVVQDSLVWSLDHAAQMIQIVSKATNHLFPC